MSEDWARRAYERFQSEASDERRLQELEVIRHEKLTAGVDRLWCDLLDLIRENAEKFNGLMNRDFLQVVVLSEDEFNVVAPLLTLDVKLDRHQNEIRAQYVEVTPAKNVSKGTSVFRFVLDKDKVWFVDANEGRRTTEYVAESLLDKLVV